MTIIDGSATDETPSDSDPPHTSNVPRIDIRDTPLTSILGSLALGSVSDGG